MSTGQTVAYYCPKSCGNCGATNGPPCSYYGSNCVNGQCQSITYFGISTFQCVCNNGFTGVYCNIRKLL
jgi:hypothetical protein